ncbi:unnamed protein product [Protopolystoma xenopodis]|uniref:Secreted protein n=1 Tax=Protopolystoma xenopodis TaxID=117903 RepID=A0A3S5FEQ1_9PLAT|nr:unnamed protein product [Protopolystoma xenopodis]
MWALPLVCSLTALVCPDGCDAARASPSSTGLLPRLTDLVAASPVWAVFAFGGSKPVGSVLFVWIMILFTRPESTACLTALDTDRVFLRAQCKAKCLLLFQKSSETNATLVSHK